MRAKTDTASGILCQTIVDDGDMAIVRARTTRKGKDVNAQSVTCPTIVVVATEVVAVINN